MLSMGNLQQPNFLLGASFCASFCVRRARILLTSNTSTNLGTWVMNTGQAQNPTYEPFSCSTSQARLTFVSKETYAFRKIGQNPKLDLGCGFWSQLSSWHPASFPSRWFAAIFEINTSAQWGICPVQNMTNTQWPKIRHANMFIQAKVQDTITSPCPRCSSSSHSNWQFKDNILTLAFQWQLLGMNLFLDWQFLATEMAICNNSLQNVTASNPIFI